ncbi:MAG: aminotransferase class I/II-fold pyridoxal phosphate-dependent enzyme [Bacillota bacterium]|nr:aminotransferase class I/II-fold pyridoxal phosphate-dependent enzyme [Bacillota bacterium]
MANLIFAEENGRTITTDDKIFSTNKLAQEMIARVGKDKVANATIGALLDDNGKLVVLSSVVKVLKELGPEDYAEYAPIAGVPSFLESVKKVVFGSYQPKAHVEAVSTPGGTGAIHNIIQNYTRRGDAVLTSDWYWGPYSTIAHEIERKIATYPLFDNDFRFNHRAFAEKVEELLGQQDRLVIILNTPAHNPTGYTWSAEDWDHVVTTLKNTAAADKKRKIVLAADIAYIDFAGDEEEYRSFLPQIDVELPENLMMTIAFSMSKGFTMYGMRAGAALCLSRNPEVAKEFKTLCSLSARGTWSNCTRASMVAMAHICQDPDLWQQVREERAKYREMLIRRGRAFTEAAREAGLLTTPYDAGFFISIPCLNSDDVAAVLNEDGIFPVALGKGLRVSLASISEEWCRIIPAKMAAAIKKVNGN